jgi:hypothetical protein
MEFQLHTEYMKLSEGTGVLDDQDNEPELDDVSKEILEQLECDKDEALEMVGSRGVDACSKSGTPMYRRFMRWSVDKRFCHMDERFAGLGRASSTRVDKRRDIVLSVMLLGSVRAHQLLWQVLGVSCLLTLRLCERWVGVCRRWINNQDEQFKKWDASSSAERKRMIKDWIKTEYETYQDRRTIVFFRQARQVVMSKTVSQTMTQPRVCLTRTFFSGFVSLPFRPGSVGIGQIQ